MNNNNLYKLIKINFYFEFYKLKHARGKNTTLRKTLNPNP